MQIITRRTRRILFIALGLLGIAGASVVALASIGPLLPSDLEIGTNVSLTGPGNIAFDGTRYLAVWSEFTDGTFFTDIYGQFVDTAGALSGSSFLIGHATRPETDPVVAFNGTHFFVVWYLNSPDTIRGQVVATNGALIGSELVVSSSSAISNLGPGVASDGSGFLAVWTDNRDFATNNSDIYGQRIAVDGLGNATLDGSNFLISPTSGHQFFPAVDFGSSSYLVTWTNDAVLNSGQFDIFSALVTPGGSVSTPITITIASGIQGNREAGIAFDGNNFLVVFDDLRDGSDDVFGARVSETGTLLDGPPATGGIQISASPGVGSPHRPKAAFDGTDWLVVWAGVRTQGARVDTSGSVLDAVPIDLYITASTQFNPGLAFDNTNYLVTWNISASPALLHAQLVGPLATPTDTPTPTATNTPTNTATNTPTNTPTNTSTHTPSPTNTPVSTTVSQFVALGEEGVWIKQGSTIINGDVGANVSSSGPYLSDSAEVSIGISVDFLDSDSRLMGDSLQLKQGSTVYDVYYNDISGNGLILGDQFSVTLPLVTQFPTIPNIITGTQNFDVPQNGALTLGSGNYGTLIARNSSVITLTGGVYNFVEWDVHDNVEVRIEAPTEIRVVERFQNDSGTYFGPAPSASGLDATDIKVIVTGINGSSGNLGGTPKAIKFGINNTIIASVYAPNGTLWIKQGSTARGAFLGKWVTVGESVLLTHESGW